MECRFSLHRAYRFRVLTATYNHHDAVRVIRKYCVTRRAHWLYGVIILISFPGRSSAQAPYGLGFIPESINEIDIESPRHEKAKISGELDAQFSTQGDEHTNNPFAYAQHVFIRSWIIYSGFPHMKLWIGYSGIQKYAIKETNTPESKEQRLTIMGTYAQKLPKGTMFEQLRYEQQFLYDSKGIHRSIPYVRGRFGLNHYLRQGSARPFFLAPNISYYTELSLRFAPKEYAPDAFYFLRQRLYYTAGITQNIHLLLGIEGKIQLSNSASNFTIFYGPIATLKYTVTRKLRETFDSVDY